MPKRIKFFESKPTIWLTPENSAVWSNRIKPAPVTLPTFDDFTVAVTDFLNNLGKLGQVIPHHTGHPYLVNAYLAQIKSPTQNSDNEIITTENEILVANNSNIVETLSLENASIVDSAPKASSALITGGSLVATWGLLKEFGIVSSDSHKHGLDQYLMGTMESVVPGYETKRVSGFGLPQEGATANKISLGFKGLRLAAERNSLGHGRLDIRVGIRNAGIGVAISVKGDKIINPYMRKAGWLGRIKKYPNHVSIKISDLSGAVNNINRASQEIRLTYAQYARMEQILKQEGEIQAARYLEKECATQIKNPTRLKMAASGLYGILGELAAYIGLGIVMDELADLAGFDPDFTGRNLVQVGATVGIVHTFGAIKRSLKTGYFPHNSGREAICSMGEAAITLGVFEAAGAFLDGTCDKLHVQKDFWGRSVTQFFITLVLMYMGKKSFTFQCNPYPPSDPREDRTEVQSQAALNLVTAEEITSTDLILGNNDEDRLTTIEPDVIPPVIPPVILFNDPIHMPHNLQK